MMFSSPYFAQRASKDLWWYWYYIYVEPNADLALSSLDGYYYFGEAAVLLVVVQQIILLCFIMQYTNIVPQVEKTYKLATVESDSFIRTDIQQDEEEAPVAKPANELPPWATSAAASLKPPRKKQGTDWIGD